MKVFQSTLPVPEATCIIFTGLDLDLFQSSLPMRGTTFLDCLTRATEEDFNPRSPCGERPPERMRSYRDTAISILAPRAGSDSVGTYNISMCTFQSTLPVRGATRSPVPRSPLERFQSTLPARGATERCKMALKSYDISIPADRKSVV